jgi:hypothetical protein
MSGPGLAVATVEPKRFTLRINHKQQDFLDEAPFGR